jgi:hypothetical protein
MTVAGNPDNAAVWGGADVLLGSVSTIIPAAGAEFALARSLSVTTVSADATITFASGAITSADVGLSITGTGIPASTTILSVTNATTAELSANATASATVTGTLGATNGWKYAGLLDPGQGFTEGIEQSQTDHSAWGYGVIATTYSDKKTTKGFTCLEENATVMGLVYDTSGMTFDDVAGTYEGDLAVRDDTTRVRIAFVTTSGTTTRWKVSKNYATVTATDAGSESEEALGSKAFEATIFPDENSVLFTTYKGAA